MAKIIKSEITKEGASYLIDFGSGMELWFDVWATDSGEITGDWNKFIFHTDNKEDMRQKAFMEASTPEAGAYNFSTALELAVNAYEASL